MEAPFAKDDKDNLNRLLKSPSSSDGPFYLAHARDLVDIAIAQQSLLAGDIFLIDLETLWASNASNWPAIAALLGEQAVLRQNLVTLAVRKAVLADSTIEAYAEAFTGDGAQLVPPMPELEETA